MTRFLPRAAARTTALVAAALALGACEVRTGDDAASVPAADGSAPTTSTAGGDVAAAPVTDPTSLPPAERPRADMRLEVDVAARQVHVYRGGARTASYPVAVGSTEWPTRTGEWTVSQVVFNPEWVPPDESWAEEREGKQPGDPENPLGEAQLIYDPPRTIHGTNDPSSVGKAVSHGSIRMTNETITALAREVLEVAGVEKDEAWYRRVRENRREKQIIDLPRVVPITVR